MTVVLHGRWSAWSRKWLQSLIGGVVLHVPQGSRKISLMVSSTNELFQAWSFIPHLKRTFVQDHDFADIPVSVQLIGFNER